MPSRAELEVRAANVNVNSANYPNDSKLEQVVVYSENLVVATGTATKLAVAGNNPKGARSGGANV